MEIRKIDNELLMNSYYEIDHESGLKIFVYPKEGYSSTYAIFGTDYGSIDADKIPNGTAHFLEHKLFESDEIDAFERFAETGAAANAYTTFDKTCYLFTCGDNFAENLKILLDFVQHPYFTQETVEKEQGIIGQEIRMYQDDPTWRSLFNLLKIVYKNHPVRIDLAGTQETISQISAEMLYDCYNKFYCLQNMALACVGNTSVEEVVKVVNEVINSTEGEHINRHFDEPYEVSDSYVEEKMSVAMPLFSFAFKEDPGADHNARPTLKEKIMTSILIDCLFGDTTEFYNDLLDDGYISTGFGAEYFTGPGYRMILFMGDSKDPKYVAEAIKKRILEVKNTGVPKESFERIRRAQYGRAIMSYNDVDGLANELITSYFEDYKLFDEIDIFKSLTLEDVNEHLSRQYDVENTSLSVILPKE